MYTKTKGYESVFKRLNCDFSLLKKTERLIVCICHAKRPKKLHFKQELDIDTTSSLGNNFKH